MSTYLDELNPEQRAAVETIEGPVMIVAGAGSGKTRVLTYRIAYLMDQGIDPWHILALTFTNKAAKEMQNRIEKLVGAEAKNLWMGTFHSIFAKILRIEAHKIGYPQNFTIYDTEDSKSLIKGIIKEEGLNDEVYKPAHVYSRISLAKNNFISPREYEQNAELSETDRASGKPKIGYLYEQYTKRCRNAGAMDFDDLLIKTYELFLQHPDVVNKYQQKFRFVMVDEYQDTNHIQYLIIKKLAAAHQNICVVGDDAQSIYAFRGASIKNILNYEKDYPDLKVFKLEQNYRSTKTIVEAASDIIKKNKYQLEKNIWTDNGIGDKIKVFKALTDNEEGVLVANSIFEVKMKDHLNEKDFAILYRTNYQSRAFEEALRRLNIPYQIIGGVSFYQRKEVKDLLAYFRLAINTNDEEAFKRVINFPARGIGDTTVSKMIVLAKENEMSLWDVAKNIQHASGIDSRGRRTVSEWVVLIQRFQVQVGSMNAFDLATEIAKTSGINKHYFEDKTIEGINRYDNLQELLGAIKEFTERTDIEDKHLGVFMQEIALFTDADKQQIGDDKVTLMTIHGAKGLEFPVVYVAGLEENLFPSQMSLTSREDLEEERRLFYVALTRARKRVFLSFAQSRFRWGQVVYSEPSRFIEEINPKFLDYNQVQPAREREGAFVGKYVVPKPVVNKPIVKASYQAEAAFVAEDVSTLQEGMEVVHVRFGQGKVLMVEGKGEDKKAKILFDAIGEKQILIKYAKMRILN
ncbi:MAG: UvrD-helicase domain-containing protein [Bacteroidetes bacterium]|nr:UvrD-helicase domain-containing protein [Bacteroidota bacterium]